MPPRSLSSMEQLDDEPEHLDAVVTFPTDFTVGGLIYGTLPLSLCEDLK